MSLESLDRTAAALSVGLLFAGWRVSRDASLVAFTTPDGATRIVVTRELVVLEQRDDSGHYVVRLASHAEALRGRLRRIPKK